MKRRIW